MEQIKEGETGKEVQMFSERMRDLRPMVAKCTVTSGGMINIGNDQAIRFKEAHISNCRAGSDY